MAQTEERVSSGGIGRYLLVYLCILILVQALKSGILIQIAPPTLGSIGVIVVMYRKRNQVKRTESGAESGEDW